MITAPLVGIAGLVRARDRHNRRMAALALGLSLVLPLIHLFVIAYFMLIDPLTFDPMD